MRFTHHAAIAVSLLLPCLFCSAADAGNTLIVNPALKFADDANPGTDDRPLKTISAAADRARAGDAIIIHLGTYREAVAIKSSGSAAQPIRFMNGSDCPADAGSSFVSNIALPLSRRRLKRHRRERVQAFAM